MHPAEQRSTPNPDKQLPLGVEQAPQRARSHWTRRGAALVALASTMALGSTAHAAGDGEPCGRFFGWETRCDAGLTCHIWSENHWGTRGYCGVPGCEQDSDCDSGFVCEAALVGPRECVPPTNATEQALDDFFATHGGRSSFPDSYVALVEAVLRAEDEVLEGRHAEAQQRLDRLYEQYPLSDDRWEDGAGHAGTNVGSPVGYYALRMLSEIARTGVSDPAPAKVSLTFGIALAQCAEGRQPVDLALTPPGREVSMELAAEMAANDHEVIRQSMRLFQKYVWAITDGNVELNPVFHQVETCAQVGFEAPSRARISNWDEIVRAVPIGQRAQTDFWWVIYPSNVPDDQVFWDAEKALISGGMGEYNDKPVFICDDKWLLRKPPHLGVGEMSEVERRVYLPQWLQHEFFHHLFRIYPEFELEAESHQWFDRSTWPDDFEGRREADYYAESVNKRIRASGRPLWQALDSTPIELSPDDLVGHYLRTPVTNGYHDVQISADEEGLVWSNASGVSWRLYLEGGALWTGTDGPYSQRILRAVYATDNRGWPTEEVVGLKFQRDVYWRQP